MVADPIDGGNKILPKCGLWWGEGQVHKGGDGLGYSGVESIVRVAVTRE